MVAISSDDDQTTKVQVLEKNIQLDKQGRKDQETRSPHCSAREEIKMEEVKKSTPESRKRPLLELVRENYLAYNSFIIRKVPSY